jgi:hypothetical protein
MKMSVVNLMKNGLKHNISEKSEIWENVTGSNKRSDFHTP